MKCPKCGYLGFETVDRCRNCGYDFSLTVAPSPSAELPLNEAEGGGAWADFALGGSASPEPPTPRRAAPDGTLERSLPALDLERLIGDEGLAGAAPSVAADAVGAEPLSSSRIGGPDRGTADEFAPARELPGRTTQDAIAPARPRPAGAPLVVRRTTPEVVRSRSRGIRPSRHEPRPLLADPEVEPPARLSQPTPEGDLTHVTEPSPRPQLSPAPRGARVVAAVIDLLLLTGIDAIILYLTLAIAGLGAADWHLLPAVPMTAFLLLLNGGYLTAFTAAGGRTIGKMVTGIRVIGDNGLAIDVSGSVLRALGGLMTMLALGLPYLPALLSADGRTLADRLAGTRVVRAG
jgi:uncharacterized RDD family membrane protein YckC